jgi:hypothetical protein
LSESPLELNHWPVLLTPRWRAGKSINQ